MTNIQQLTLDLMLAHNIDYEEADRRSKQYCDAVGSDRPDVLNDGWISVDDRLPDLDSIVLTYEKTASSFNGNPSSRYNKCKFSLGKFWLEEVNDNWEIDAIFWQPLPQPPKGQ